MRRWRLVILLLVFLPVYLWLMMSIGFVVSILVFEPGEYDFSMLSGLLDPEEWWEDIITEKFGWCFLLIPGLLLAATQIAFVAPAFSRRMRMGRGGGRPLWLTLVGAALIGGILTVGLFYSLGELLQFWEDGEMWAFGYLEGKSWGSEGLAAVVFWLLILVGWAIWIPLLYVFTRRTDPKRLHNRLVIVLLGGTIIETLVIVPVDIMVRRRTDCYCETGTFLALCCSIWALLWLTGPGIILAVTSRRRRRWGDTHCLNCGYAKGPTPGDRCPECGFEWVEEG